jgi:hypothetical protein
MSYKIANTSWVQLAFSGVLLGAISLFHSSLRQVVLVQLALMVLLFIFVAVPFLINSLTDPKDILAPGSSRPVRLIRRISEDAAIAEFLKSDFHIPAFRDYHKTLNDIVMHPNFGDPGWHAFLSATTCQTCSGNRKTPAVWITEVGAILRLIQQKDQTKDGQFVAADDTTFAAAAANADWSAAPGFGISLVSQPGARAWPITGATFILVYKTPDKPEQVAEVLKFYDWSYRSGDKLASDLDYVPLPDKASDQVRQVWSKEIKGKDGKPLFAAKGS